jgi:hypothetical protein
VDVIGIDLIDMDLTDEKLTAEAMAADPDAPIAPDAVPFAAGGDSQAMLPQWYMPVPSSRRSRGRVITFAVLAGSLVAGNVAGFCVTSGFPEFLWH